ncbi:MAG: hypothetical protein F4Y18_01285 [Cenarchaeum sp. SB0663_bin_5]|nr:hypothetical protein [Cenarchaeum sp. SB0663_bin_5]MYH04358.1 hypothetical protein [Cenarchaeum sp. SB0675_bin_21]MYL10746.1 hypothetical protein [Cenarchaeum sp. SB0669_bin_11]
MADIFDIFTEYSYAGIFAILVALNAAPLLMPPTWIVLASFYTVDPTYDVLLLSLVGSSGATLGRFILQRYSSFFRRFAGPQRRAGLDIINKTLSKRRYGYGVASFLFAATPLPSNMLFVAYGLMGAKNIGMYVGFWCGRVVSYYVMISVSRVVLVPFLQLFQDRYVGILVADAAGVGVVILFACIDWDLLLTDKKLRFIRPRVWRL